MVIIKSRARLKCKFMCKQNNEFVVSLLIKRLITIHLVKERDSSTAVSKKFSFSLLSSTYPPFSYNLRHRNEIDLFIISSVESVLSHHSIGLYFFLLLSSSYLFFSSRIHQNSTSCADKMTLLYRPPLIKVKSKGPLDLWCLYDVPIPQLARAVKQRVRKIMSSSSTKVDHNRWKSGVINWQTDFKSQVRNLKAIHHDTKPYVKPIYGLSRSGWQMYHYINRKIQPKPSFPFN